MMSTKWKAVYFRQDIYEYMDYIFTKYPELGHTDAKEFIRKAASIAFRKELVRLGIKMSDTGLDLGADLDAAPEDE